MQGVYEELMELRLKEIEKWKNKYHVANQLAEEEKVNRNTLIDLINFIHTHTEIKSNSKNFRIDFENLSEKLRKLKFLENF